MDQQEAKQLISDSKNICLVPVENEPESLCACLALFYSLKESGKSVNVVADKFPDKLGFLIPSLDFISRPQNLVISIPKSVADVSQIYYEKTEENLKIHLTASNGLIKKENVSFYFQNPSPDLIITLGIDDFAKYLESKLDSFGFLLDCPILNISESKENKMFGRVNLIEDRSIAESVLDLIKSIDVNLTRKNVAECLLAGLLIHYENFKSKDTDSQAFDVLAELTKRGASYGQITEKINKTTEGELKFISRIFQNLKTADGREDFFSLIVSDEFENFGEQEAVLAVEKIKTIGIENDLLALWQSHSSEPTIKGFFYSKKTDLINKISANLPGSQNKEGWLFLSTPGTDINFFKDKIMNIVS